MKSSNLNKLYLIVISICIILINNIQVLSQETTIKKDSILNCKIGDLENLKLLLDYHIITQQEAKFIGSFMIMRSQETGAFLRFDTLTFGAFLDTISAFKENLNHEIASKNNFGQDSIFIRNPYGQKLFLGMGEMSLEKLVLRESENLPYSYDIEEINEHLSIPVKVLEIISEYGITKDIAFLFGNVINIKIRNGEDMTKYRIGDIIEISERIRDSKEFKPFVQKE